MRKAFLQQKAKEDVREIVLYIADDNLKAAEAFRLALERARLTLAELPEVGSAYDFGNRELKGLRVLPVPDFPKFLVFYVYREPEEEVEISFVFFTAPGIFPRYCDGPILIVPIAQGRTGLERPVIGNVHGVTGNAIIDIRLIRRRLTRGGKLSRTTGGGVRRGDRQRQR